MDKDSGSNFIEDADYQEYEVEPKTSKSKGNRKSKSKPYHSKALSIPSPNELENDTRTKYLEMIEQDELQEHFAYLDSPIEEEDVTDDSPDEEEDGSPLNPIIKNHSGRRGLLTSNDQIKEIAKYLKMGQSPTAICLALNINIKTWGNWLKKGEAARPTRVSPTGKLLYKNKQTKLYRNFYEAVNTSTGLAIMKLRKILWTHAQFDPIWADKFLTKTDPEWAQKTPTKVEISGPSGSPIQYNTGPYINDESEQRATARILGALQKLEKAGSSTNPPSDRPSTEGTPS